MSWGNPRAVGMVMLINLLMRLVFGETMKKPKTHPDIMAINTHKAFHESRAVQTCALPLITVHSIFTAVVIWSSLDRYTCHGWVQLARKRNLCPQPANATTTLIERHLEHAVSCLFLHLSHQPPETCSCFLFLSLLPGAWASHMQEKESLRLLHLRVWGGWRVPSPPEPLCPAILAMCWIIPGQFLMHKGI